MDRGSERTHLKRPRPARGREAIRDRLTELWDYPRSGAPWRRGDRWFQHRNTGLQDQDVLWTADAPEAEGTVLDANQLSEEGTTALSDVAVSDSGAFVALGLSHAGSDWRRWRVRRVSTGEELPDRVEWSKFASAAWTPDDAGFFYGRYPQPPADAAYDAPNLNMEVRYHRLGTDSAGDTLVFATPDHLGLGLRARRVRRRPPVLTVWRGTDPENRTYVADLADGVEAAVVRPVLDEGDARYEHIASFDRTLYLLTDRDAPLGRVIAVDVDDPDNPREVIPEADEALEHARLVGVGCRLSAPRPQPARDLRAGRPPHRGRRASEHWVDRRDGRPAPRRRAVPDVRELRLAACGPRRPHGRWNGPRGRAPALAWNPQDFLSEQVFVTSGDGTHVPLFLTRRRDVAPNGDVPTLLYGYGGFQVPTGPTFKPEWLAWMERGGLLAVASLRGGGEYGKAWHDAGRLANKQNVFDDFAACLRWLASSGWTRRERIAISGRSNGGLLVGATITQHPELVGAALAEVGVMDMLRFHRFTIGWGWTSDFGSADDPEQFRTLLAYSPLHNVRPDVAYRRRS